MSGLPVQGLAELAVAGGAGSHAAQFRDRPDGLGFLDAEAGFDGDARVVGPNHLARPLPAGITLAQALFPAPGCRPGAAARFASSSQTGS